MGSANTRMACAIFDRSADGALTEWSPAPSIRPDVGPEEPYALHEEPRVSYI
jgi:hypothetical protein